MSVTVDGAFNANVKSLFDSFQNGLHNVDLFDESILKNIDFSDNPLKIEHGLSPTNAGENLILRPLNSDDYDKGLLSLRIMYF